MATTTQSYRRRDRSLRLSFRFERAEITLFDRRELDMKALPSNDLETRKPEEWSGFWIEVQDDTGRVLYRRGMQHPMIRRSEAVADDGSFSNHLWAPEQGAFSVVVPSLPRAAELVMFASPTERPDIPGPASEILRIRLYERGPQGHDQVDTPEEA